MSDATLTEKIRFITSALGNGKLSKSGKNFDIWCPFCAPTDRTKKKLSIRISDDANHCWTCEWRARSLIPLLKKFATREELSFYIDKFNPTLKKHVKFNEEETKVIKLPDDFRLLATVIDSIDPDVRAIKNYLLKKRNVTINDLWFFKIGVSEQQQFRRCAIVPSFDINGQLNYYVSRTIDNRTYGKYDNPDVKKNTIIFNEINIDWKKTLTLVEGVFDMFKCGINTVPLLGSTLNEESLLFNNIIAHNTPIALSLDPNMRLTKVPQIIKKLEEYDIDVSVVDVRPFEDPGSMTKSEFESCYAVSKKLSWNDTIKLKMERRLAHRLSI